MKIGDFNLNNQSVFIIAELSANHNGSLETAIETIRAAKRAGLPALTSFSIDSNDWLKYKTYITQEMLKKGILAGHSVYVCTKHTDEVIGRYFEEFEPVLAKIVQFENGELSVDEHLEGPVCHGGFKRLN